MVLKAKKSCLTIKISIKIKVKNKKEPMIEYLFD